MVLSGTAAAAGPVGSAVGLDELIERLGFTDRPRGDRVVVAMVEAFPAGTSDYHPQLDAPLRNKTFYSVSGPSGTSGHATRVARNLCGVGRRSPSIAPAITSIHLFSAEGWIGDDLLRAAEPDAVPLPSPYGVKIFNNSWIGTYPDGPLPVQSVLRRADYVIGRDGVLIISGVNNGTDDDDNVPLMSHMYNGISVGRPNGRHQVNTTRDDVDGPGRMKPEIVAPGDPDCCTSFSTAVVSAAAAIMIETARTTPRLRDDPRALRPEVLKAVLLAGARHRAGWTNHPDVSGPTRGVTDRPIDPIYGVDLLDIDASHRILTGGHQGGDSVTPTRGRARAAAWSLTSVPIDGSTHYRFVVPETAVEASFLITWNRILRPPFGDDDFASADLDLFLWRERADGELESLVGEAGRTWFREGNVVSESPVDNVEHLYLRGLRAGKYVLEVRRQDQIVDVPMWDAAVAWVLPEPPAGLRGDVNNDGLVDVADLISIIIEWGRCGACPEDVNDDGVVDAADAAEVLGAAP
jgi:hypothetical protein